MEETKIFKKRMGKPPIFDTNEQVEEAIENYFNDCDNKIVRKIINKNDEILETVTTPYTMGGLAIALGMSRETLCAYAKNEKYSDTITQARNFIESNYEERGLINASNTTMTIFCLKNNYKWKDKHEEEVQSVPKTIIINTYDPNNKSPTEAN